MRHKTRVVVVDDDGDLRHLVRVTLETHGAFSVVGEAETAHSAIELASRHQPDAVVLDLRLPDIHGSELLAAIREAAPQARIVVYTGSEQIDPTLLHSGELRVRYSSGVLRIEVLDGSVAMPEPRQPNLTEASGRGLMLIAALAHAWGIDPHPGGKLVWAEIAGAA